MTSHPHTISRDQTLAAAHDLMRRYDVRHLPVLQAGKLVGVVSQRDLYLIETLMTLDTQVVPVSEAMTTEVYCVDPSTPLRDVVGDMAAYKYGCAVIAEAGKVVGIFTTTDALNVLQTELEGRAKPTAPRR